MIKATALFLFMMLGGCVTGHVLRESNRPIPEIRSAVLWVTGEPRQVLEGERTYISKYFSRKGESFFDANKSKERLYARISIQGDRRPYDILVQVIIEERVEGRYEEVGVDEALSDQVAEEVRKRLTRSRDQRNIIDDFQVF